MPFKFSFLLSTDKKKELQRFQQEEKQQSQDVRSTHLINKLHSELNHHKIHSEPNYKVHPEHQPTDLNHKLHTELDKPKFFRAFEEAYSERSAKNDKITKFKLQANLSRHTPPLQSGNQASSSSQHSVRSLYSYVASISNSSDTNLRQINKSNLQQQSISPNRRENHFHLTELNIHNQLSQQFKQPVQQTVQRSIQSPANQQLEQTQLNFLSRSNLDNYINNSLQFAEHSSNSSTCSSQSKGPYLLLPSQLQASSSNSRRSIFQSGLEEAIHSAFSDSEAIDKTDKFTKLNSKELKNSSSEGSSSSSLIKPATFVYEHSKDRSSRNRKKNNEDEERRDDYKSKSTKMFSMKTSVEDTPPVVGIIGGTGIDRDADYLEKKCIIRVKDTIYGAPSENEVVQAQVGRIKIFLISRHGHNHSINPSNVNYRANIRLLQKLGCNIVLATTACGSLKQSLKPGDFIVLDSYIDRTKGVRESTFHPVSHIPQAHPFDATTRNCIIRALKFLNYEHEAAGTTVTIEGPRFSTTAESYLYKSWGASIVNMTTVPEASLAAEAGMAYAALGIVTDYDCWHEDEDESVCIGLVDERLKTCGEKARKVILKTLRFIEEADYQPIISRTKRVAQQSIMCAETRDEGEIRVMSG